ncbi:hypothetical protein Taro_029732 [Colocasia esculenta]|uniref:Glutaredoxin domain-containing protein n=1 Tax=Colocasia esculenta TaxID=4460 RepID=A0A843W158_COLES|nr:hypothetical protein [Colocasia esculenta]
MWPPWGAVPRGGAAVSASPSPLHPSFSSTTSFKDVHSLLADEASPDSVVHAPKKPSIFHRVRSASSALRTWRAIASLGLHADPSFPAAGEKRIVVYFTSLRVVRKTFEDCRSVRSILRGFRVAIDERDLSMDSGFLNELKGILGRKQLTLPRVFIGGRYMGGAEEIWQLHESGELKKYVEGVPLAEPGMCESCGGFRFLLCDKCSGSHKFYSEKGGFRSCTFCNENGLLRCSDCSRSDAL